MPRGRFRRAAVAGSVLVAVATLVSGCFAPQYDTGARVDPRDVVGDPAAPGSVREGGALTMGLSSEPDELDPTRSSSLYTRYVMSSICDKLYDLDARGAVVPQLATALPEITDGGRTVSIPVRGAGVRFADGTAFDAGAVATSLRRHLTLPGSQRRNEMGPVTAIDPVGPDRVVLRYSRPFAPITAALADRAGMIMSPAALARDAAGGGDFADDPVCVGPFRFVERVPQTAIVVDRDPLYHDAGAVHLDRITYRIMPDSNVRAANLRSGDIQVADTISAQDVDALAREDDVTVLRSNSLGYSSMVVNVGNVDGAGNPQRPRDTPLARDPRLRLALSAAIDRTRLTDVVFNGWYTPACSPIPPQTAFGSAADVGCPRYDPAAARELLRASGVPLPVPITVSVATQADSLRAAQAVQAAVAEVGFDLRIVPVEYSSLLDAQDAGDFETTFSNWSGRVDPDGNTTRFLASDGSSNYAGYADPQVDALLEAATGTTDVAERTRLYTEATLRVQADNPIVYLYRQRNLTALRDEVRGVQTFTDGVVRLGRAGFAVGTPDGGTP